MCNMKVFEWSFPACDEQVDVLEKLVENVENSIFAATPVIDENGSVSEILVKSYEDEATVLKKLLLEGVFLK
ncbi:hypothetical protein L4C39_19790 [Vibrio clamense]|uniref:hypothetical protein n=1 Tax=Vibrio clamense TaxID=2910254 RepID=UPI003D2210D0